MAMGSVLQDATLPDVCVAHFIPFNLSRNLLFNVLQLDRRLREVVV
jgi:hypothetical protein